MSYLNTIPFIYGIEHAPRLHASLILCPPSGCAAAFKEGRADLALLPAGALGEISAAKIVTPYCIGASSPVRTVTLMSDCPLPEIRRIYLDGHSRTSSLLVKILASQLWNINPEWIHMDDYGVVDNRRYGDGFLLIGDKVFDYEGKFKHILDLSVEWNRLTGLPFAFAVWVARDNVPQGQVDELTEALGNGISHIREAIHYYGHSGKEYAYEYLTQNIDFLFDDQKRRALELFWEMGCKFVPAPNPG